MGFRHVSGLNFRLCRPVFGIGRSVMRALIKPGGGIFSTLIVAPPAAGKTTLLRDLIRTLSYGAPELGIRPHRVGVADERGEIGGGFRGVAQIDLGPRTDIIELCPKRHALKMILRGMGPEVLATDEIGHPQDGEAVLDAVLSGVSVICTAHGASLDELYGRPSLRPLLEERIFLRTVVLSRRLGPGTLEQIGRGERK